CRPRAMSPRSQCLHRHHSRIGSPLPTCFDGTEGGCPLLRVVNSSVLAGPISIEGTLCGTPGTNKEPSQARTILVLSQVTRASVRGIQECRAEILGTARSVGYVEGVLLAAAARALQVVPPGPVRAEADEIFAAGRPV